ncbi:hypothetical protein FJT64_007566 [Amphibalanus amphitrite]|uniref:Uncharacterized protein n=1 Tax=Amphibalanus amphitrite TaxID=1232801 RepID=A0A6A4VEK7_AMPAM|nr:hypothetical protein FJT64_007566 [Amphibalanus amphitrite]
MGCEYQLRIKLIHKFKNSRKRKAPDSPMLQDQRKAKKCESGKGNGMPGHSPPSAGVDPVETMRLMNKLRQLEKGPEESAEENALMRQLFPERRRLIVDKKRTIADINQ